MSPIRNSHHGESVASAPEAEREAIVVRSPWATGPTVMERIIGALPLPYILSAALFATVLGPPATFVLGLVGTGDMDTSVELFYGGAPPTDPFLQAVAIMFWWLTYFVIFWAVRWERLAIAREGNLLARVIPADIEAPRITRQGSAFLPAALIGIALTVVSYPFIADLVGGVGSFQDETGALIWSIHNGLRLALFYLGAGTLFWLTTASLLTLLWLGRQPLELLPLEEDGHLGLKPAGSKALVMASTYFGVVSLLALQLVLAPAMAPFAITLGGTLVIGIALFIAPLWRLHRMMDDAKSRRQAAVRTRLLQLAFPGGPGSDLGGDGAGADPDALEASLARASEVLSLEAAGRKLDASPTWPFDPEILERLGAVMLPLVIALLTELARQLLGF